MEKQIPIYFDSVIIESPFKEISETTPNIGRLKVRVFTKYSNRNGSYITEEVANQLIQSATEGNTPVVGFFDPETKTWASHTGPTLANAYGYVEDFLGWQSFEDTDGITREYAVFSVILFSDYFDEAKKILGQNQSMELDPNSITGDWANIEGQEYFVYTTAKMLSFCIIGDHEPCFSVSAFFSKNDNTYESQVEKFSSLLSSLKTQVEEVENIQKGGEQPMNEFENQEVVEETPDTTVEETVVEEEKPVEEFAAESSSEETSNKVQEETIDESVNDASSDFELLQNQFNELQTSFTELQTQYNTAKEQHETAIAALNTELENLRNSNADLTATIATYEAQSKEIENQCKNELFNKYAEVLDEQEIADLKTSIDTYSYEELESKLAIIFANNKINNTINILKVPVIEPQESQFALLMRKYRKN